MPEARYEWEQGVKISINLFRLALAAGWALLFILSFKAVSMMGTDAASALFFGDMAHPWRGQFNTDFGLHLLLVASWLSWRDRLWYRGLLLGVLAIVFGAVFTFAFLIVESFRLKGDVRSVLLGARV
ncbi:MAG: hypothetical protein ABW128_09450 [Rhizorhabdus sp.]